MDDATEDVLSQDAADELQRVLGVAYAYLNRRDRTVAEMRAKLRRSGTQPAAIDEAVATLIDQGYLDDERFARLLTEDKRRLESWGNERISRTLSERGVDRDVIEHALETCGEPRGELGRAVELLKRRFPLPPADRRERNRALGLLLRKGYESELALEALASYAHER